MPRQTPCLWCAECGAVMTKGKTSLVQGQARCLPCRRAAKPDKVCDRCNKQFRPDKPSTRYCSRRCHNPPRICLVCSTEYRPSYVSQRCCGRLCGAVLKGAERPPKVAPEPRAPRSSVWIKDCDQCGRTFVARHCQVKRCSTQCRIDHEGVRVKDLYATALALRLGGVEWRRLLVDYLRDRDGDKCKICNRRMDFTLTAGPRGEDAGVTVDHVVPRSHGGSDDPANLRLAHWSCNRQRKAKGGGEQLALVG